LKWARCFKRAGIEATKTTYSIEQVAFVAFEVCGFENGERKAVPCVEVLIFITCKWELVFMFTNIRNRRYNIRTIKNHRDNIEKVSKEIFTSGII